MKRMATIWVLAILLIFPSKGITEQAFRFAVFSDSRGHMVTEKRSDNDAGVSPVLPVIVEDVLHRHKSAPISLVVFPGDMISGALPRD